MWPKRNKIDRWWTFESTTFEKSKRSLINWRRAELNKPESKQQQRTLHKSGSPILIHPYGYEALYEIKPLLYFVKQVLFFFFPWCFSVVKSLQVPCFDHSQYLLTPLVEFWEVLSKVRKSTEMWQSFPLKDGHTDVLLTCDIIIFYILQN